MSKANLLLHIDEHVEGNELAGEPSGWQRTGKQAYFEVMSQSGREFQLAQQMHANITHLMKCAYFAGANSRLRLSKGEVATPTRVFNVESVINEREENRFLVWSCVEVV